MDKPERTYYYNGIFTDCRSVDLMLKIISTLIAFVILIIFIAWQITKRVSELYKYNLILIHKHYRFAPFDKSLQLKTFETLCKRGAFTLSDRWRSELAFPIVTSVFENHSVLCIDDWKLTVLYEYNKLFNNYFSKAPSTVYNYYLI